MLGQLASVLNRFRTAYVVVDVVDASTKHENLVGILCTLRSDAQFTKLRLAVTSREIESIKAAFRDHAISMSMATEDVPDDIRRYVESKLYQEP